MIGKSILHYRIIEKLGAGGMGIVYLAEDTRLKRQVAIKFLPPHISNSDTDRKRFEIEAQAAAALNHPNIATIFAIEENEDQPFIVMEYISGQELSDVISEHSQKQMEMDDVLDLVKQIAKGLQAAHQNGIIHRDIKSGNIMLTPDGLVKIMDFGLAKVRGSVMVTQAGTTLGTAVYMSPQQVRGEEADEQSDIWALGVIFYELLTGQLPFSGAYEQAIMYSILNETPKSISYLRDDVPAEVILMLNKMLEKEQDQRYQSVNEFLEDLRNFQSPQQNSQIIQINRKTKNSR